MSTETIVRPWYEGIEDRVVSAYKAKGLRAEPYQFFADAAVDGCCAVGALCHGVKAWHPGVGDGDLVGALKVAARIVEAPANELEQFVYGFDYGNEPSPYGFPDDRSAAWHAGYNTAKAVIAAGLLV